MTLNRPHWDNTNFKFDMVMPKTNTDNKSKWGFKIQGEILIVFYQSRLNGGNNMIGEVSFDLSEVSKSGTEVDILPSEYQVRSIVGTHPLISRGGDEVVIDILSYVYTKISLNK